MKNDDWSYDEIIRTFSGVAKAEVDITLTGSLLVKADGEIKAISEIDNMCEGSLYTGDAIAVVDIDAAGDVTVDEDGKILADADIDNKDDLLLGRTNEFTGNADADVYITTPGMVTVDGLVKANADVDNGDRGKADIYSGSAYANVWIDNILGDGVTVGPDGEVAAMAVIYVDDNYWVWFCEYDDSDNDTYSGDASAGVDIETCGDVIVDGQVEAVADIDIDDDNREND